MYGGASPALSFVYKTMHRIARRHASRADAWRKCGEAENLIKAIKAKHPASRVCLFPIRSPHFAYPGGTLYGLSRYLIEFKVSSMG